MEISNSGQLMNFEYKPYHVTPPAVPSEFAPTGLIVEQLTRAEWTKKLEYLSNDYYDVPKSGLYVVYHSSFLYHSFDAVTGQDLTRSHDDDDEITPKQFVVVKDATSGERLERVEDIIGIPSSMKRIRKAEVDDNYVGIVWRDEAYKQPEDKSMNQFVLDRFEHTVKATVHKDTGELRLV